VIVVHPKRHFLSGQNLTELLAEGDLAGGLLPDGFFLRDPGFYSDRLGMP
jgi:hypothetical protein